MKNAQLPLSRSLIFVAAGLILAYGVTRTFAANSSPTTRPDFPLASLPAMPSANVTVDQLQRLFPAFRHAPFQSAGFKPLQLPFLFSDPEHVGNADEALAMSFLMSFAMDWAPTNYSTRHAYFTFKRSPELMQALSQNYDPTTIAQAAQQWDCTDVMGGMLTKHAAGYSGKLMIFDPQGQLVFSRSYDKPVEFFDLLGDMCADAMKFFGYTPSDALASYLHEKQCKNPASIALLGSAGFMPERTPDEFAIYQKILDQDPDFGDVRFWWADQKHWDDNKGDVYMASMAKALIIHMNISELDNYAEWVDYTHANKKALNDFYAQAEKLVDRDMPRLLQARLYPVEHQRDIPWGVPERALRVAVDNPNQHWMVERLGDAFAQGFGAYPDRDIASSLLLCAATDNYLTGTGSKESAILSLAEQAQFTGHPDVAVGLIKGLRQPAGSRFSDLELALEDSANFLDAAKLMDQYKGTELAGEELRLAAMVATVSAALADHPDLMDRLENKFKSSLADNAIQQLLIVYRSVLNGQKPDLAALNDALDSGSFGVMRERYLLLAQLDQMAGTLDFVDSFAAYADAHPLDRLCWFLYERYEQNQPSANGSYLLDGLAWSFPDDPWVRSMTGEREQRGIKPQPVDLQQVLGALAGFSPEQNPKPNKTTDPIAEDLVRELSAWHVAAAVHAALERGDRATATEIALRYRHATIAAQRWAVERFAAHLMHLCQDMLPPPAPSTAKP